MKRLTLLSLLALAACASPPPRQAENPSPQPSLAREAARIIPERRFAALDYLIVDKSERMMIGYAGGQPVRVWRGLQFGDAPRGHKRFEGDERTPEGRYVIEGRNPASAYHLSLKISYPNAADRAFARSQGRSPGGDIYLHGQPNGLPAGRVPGDWTDGCIALSNAEIEELWRIVPDGTVIEIRP
ncbi:L,D-transpeptidase family protein [Porphyrobacter sp. YT40]|uniref:L,D-transpeptidase family protein n=1 Tax=Porphyrobacter sp. YT40 TaxID=2547601 RepID=UPI0011438AD1|nr:L,D-transpeptidase family protein [Porphyrobacter sp. YT40]QDH35534.1 L,D-transpeptidase family protein [Porphyrobacter sp. YT40]